MHFARHLTVKFHCNLAPARQLCVRLARLSASNAGIQGREKKKKPMTASQRRFQLRQATTAAHTALDEMVGHFNTAADYGRYLAGIAGFRLAVEPALSSVETLDGFGQWSPNRISGELAQDLADLGIGINKPVAGAPSSDPERLLGIGYVLEGSALGAKLLRQRAAELGFNETFGARHLAAQTVSPDSWRNFLAALDAHPSLDMDKVCAAANETFAIARRAFEKHADAA